MSAVSTLTPYLHRHEEAASHAVHELFVAMLGGDAWRLTAEPEPCRNPIIGAIHLAGPWHGLVLAGFEPSLAFAVTAHMLGRKRPTAYNEDVRDAVGEIANILAGNLKALLPFHTEMSLPAVIEGSQGRSLTIPGIEISRLYFQTQDGLFWLTMAPLPDSADGGDQPVT